MQKFLSYTLLASASALLCACGGDSSDVSWQTIEIPFTATAGSTTEIACDLSFEDLGQGVTDGEFCGGQSGSRRWS